MKYWREVMGKLTMMSVQNQVLQELILRKKILPKDNLPKQFLIQARLWTLNRTVPFLNLQARQEQQNLLETQEPQQLWQKSRWQQPCEIRRTRNKWQHEQHIRRGAKGAFYTICKKFEDDSTQENSECWGLVHVGKLEGLFHSLHNTP